MTDGSSEEHPQGTLEDFVENIFEHIVRPLLTGDEEDYGRLIRFVELNDEETVGALFRETLKKRGGRELLEGVFFAMTSPDGASEASRPGLRALARTLAGEMTGSFAERFKSAVRLGEQASCVALMSVLTEFADSAWASKVLSMALLARDGEVRVAASQALFELRGADCGYDPEDPPAEREEIVQELFGLTKKS